MPPGTELATPFAIKIEMIANTPEGIRHSLIHLPSPSSYAALSSCTNQRQSKNPNRETALAAQLNNQANIPSSIW
jgi:hypothetical protein